MAKPKVVKMNNNIEFEWSIGHNCLTVCFSFTEIIAMFSNILLSSIFWINFDWKCKLHNVLYLVTWSKNVKDFRKKVSLKCIEIITLTTFLGHLLLFSINVCNVLYLITTYWWHDFTNKGYILQFQLLEINYLHIYDTHSKPCLIKSKEMRIVKRYDRRLYLSKPCNVVVLHSYLP